MSMLVFDPRLPLTARVGLCSDFAGSLVSARRALRSTVSIMASGAADFANSAGERGVARTRLRAALGESSCDQWLL